MLIARRHAVEHRGQQFVGFLRRAELVVAEPAVTVAGEEGGVDKLHASACFSAAIDRADLGTGRQPARRMVQRAGRGGLKIAVDLDRAGRVVRVVDQVAGRIRQVLHDFKFIATCGLEVVHSNVIDARLGDLEEAGGIVAGTAVERVLGDNLAADPHRGTVIAVAVEGVLAGHRELDVAFEAHRELVFGVAAGGEQRRVVRQQEPRQRQIGDVLAGDRAAGGELGARLVVDVVGLIDSLRQG